MQWRVVALLAKLRALRSLMYVFKDPLIGSLNEPQSLQSTKETTKYLRFWFPESAARHVDYVWFDTLYWYTSVGLLWHPETKLVDSIRMQFNQKAVKFQSLYCVELNNGGIRGTTYSSPTNNQAPTFGTTLPMPLMQHRSWHNMSNDSHVRQREMHGSMQHPQSNHKLLCFSWKVVGMFHCKAENPKHVSMCISPPFMCKKNQKNEHII